MRFKLIAVAAAGLLLIAGGCFWLWPGAETEKSIPSSGTEPAVLQDPSSAGTPVVRRQGASSRLGEEREPSPLLRFRPETGSTLAYRFDTSSNARIDIGFLMPESRTRGQAPESMEVVRTLAGGELRIKFYPHGPDSWEVAAVITGLDYRINDEVPYWIEAMEYPFVFRMDHQGLLDDFRFTRGIPTVARELTREILYSMQVLLPQGEKRYWQTREIDPSGRYRAEYTLKNVDEKQNRIELQKRKTGYLSSRLVRNPLSRAAGASRPEIEESEADIQMPLDGEWLQKIRYREKSRSVANGNEWSTGSRVFRAERIQVRGGDDFPETFAGVRNRLNSDVYLAAEVYQTDPVLDRLGAGLDMEEAIDFFLRLRDSESEEERRLAEKFLVNYLRQHPWASFDLVDTLDASTEGRIDDSAQLVLWRLLTEAGHSEAQQALGQAAAGHGYSELTRWRAVSYAHDFNRPEAELVDHLWRIHSDQSGQVDRELQEIALYALGSLGGKEDIGESLGISLKQQLKNSLLGSVNLQEQRIALAAIGNTGSAEMLDTIQPYLSNDDPGVRAAACDALRRMKAPGANEMLIGHYQREASPSVRETAVRTLSKLPPDPESARWARKEVLRAQGPDEQVAMVRLLGRSLDEFPENETALRQLLDRNPARKVKREVYRYISPF